MLDDSAWPACSTQKATSTHAQWNYVGEGFVKELDFSRVWLRLNESDEGDNDDIVGELKIETVKFLQEALVRIPWQVTAHIADTLQERTRHVYT